jgi:uncharacterized protein (TIGR02588 family)
VTDAGRPDEEDGDGGAAETSGWEWLTAALGLVLVLGAVTVLVLHAVRGGDAPPDLVVRVERVVPAGTGYVAEFEVENRGDGTAAAVTVHGEVAAPAGAEGAAETSETRLDHVPGRSVRRGGLLFTRDPRTAPLRVRATGYTEP